MDREFSDIGVQRGAQLAIRVWEMLLVSLAQHVLCLLRMTNAQYLSLDILLEGNPQLRKCPWSSHRTDEAHIFGLGQRNMREVLSSLEATVFRNTNHQIEERSLRAVDRPIVAFLLFFQEPFYLFFKSTRGTTVNGATIHSGTKTAETVLEMRRLLGRFSFSVTPWLTMKVPAL